MRQKINRVGIKNIALVGEYSPPHAGMAVQAEALIRLLPNEDLSIKPIVTNYNFKGPLRLLNTARGLRGILRLLVFFWQCRFIFSANIVHIFSSSGMNYWLFTVPAVFLSRLMSVPVIVNYHGGNAESFFKGRRKLLDWTLKSRSSLVVPSGFLDQIFSNMGHPADIIPNVIDIHRFSYRKREKYRPRILVCRNFTQVYNVACAIRTFAILQSKYSDASLVLAGDGPERVSLENLVKELNLKNVKFLGNVPNIKMSEIYDGADIFLNTSNVDNMPNCILEAFASGLPVVSTNVGGIPFLVSMGKTGLLVPTNDHNALAASICRILEDQELANKMTQKAYESLESYTASNVEKLWRQYYDNILNSG